jgi:hypothetical protein
MLFFYASANVLKIPSKRFYLRDVPTNATRGGDFSQLLAQRTPVVIKDPLGAPPFRITSSRQAASARFRRR